MNQYRKFMNLSLQEIGFHYFQFGILNALVFLIASCTPTSSSDTNLALVLKTNKVTVINGGLRSCKARSSDTADLSAPSFLLPKLEMTWSGNKKFTLYYIKIVLKSSSFDGGRYTFWIRDDELSLIFGVTEFAKQTDPYKNICELRVGGLPIKDLERSASGSGDVIFYGITEDEDGNSIDAQANQSFSFYYTGSL